jgi:P4 family phage/plasmid primase-like protien
MVKHTLGLSGDVANISDDKYEELCQSADVYEVTPMDTPIKLFCDIDVYDTEFGYEDYIGCIDIVTQIAIDQVTQLVKRFGYDAKYTVCDSSSPNFTCWKTKKQKWKISRHIIFHNILATKRQQSVIFKYLNQMNGKTLSDYIKNENLFDVSVYSIEKFRAVYASKPNENRPLVIKKGTFNDSVLSAFFENCYVIDDNDILELREAIAEKVFVPTPSEKGEDWLNEFLISQYIQKGLLTKYAKDYGEWFKITATICNMFEEETAWRLVDAFSRLAPNYDECGNRKLFYKLLGNGKDFGIQHIRTHAMKVDKKVYIEIEAEKKRLIAEKKEEEKHLKRQELKKKQLEKFIPKDNDSITTCETETTMSESEKLIDMSLNDTVPTDYDIAKALYNFKDIYHSHHAKCWYIFDKKWKTDLSGSIISNILSNDFHKIIDNMAFQLLEAFDTADDEVQEMLKKRLCKLTKLSEKVRKSTDKSHILTELKAIAHDETIRTKMNRQKFLLPLNEYVIDLRTQELIPMTKYHLFDYECGANYVQLTQEQEQYVRDYFMQIFCNNEQTMQCFLDIIKTNMAGILTRFIYFWVGTGRNGKSLLLKIINKILDKTMDTISKDVILMKKSNSHLSTEFEKLDKLRIGFITELSDTDVLNIDNIKKITGGDPIDVRGICKTNETIYPTLNIHAAMNELPSFKGQDAIGDRLIIIPFNNKFDVNIGFEDEIMSRLDWIFSYIVDHGRIMDTFETSEEMQVAKEEYQEDNNSDNLAEFIESKCEEGQTQTTNFMIAYQDWLKKMKRWEKPMTTNTFSRRMKKLGYENKVLGTPAKRYYMLNVSF